MFQPISSAETSSVPDSGRLSVVEIEQAAHSLFSLYRPGKEKFGIIVKGE
jgi:hypothetical protein